MKKKFSPLTILIASLIFLISCTKGERPSPTNNANNNTNNTNNTTTTGSISIKASWSTSAPWNACGSPFTVVIGLGYNSNDVINEAFFVRSNFYSSPATFTKENLTAGIYYYKAKKTYNINTCGCCGNEPGPPPTVSMSGSFTIIAGQTTSVTGINLN